MNGLCRVRSAPSHRACPRTLPAMCSKGVSDMRKFLISVALVSTALTAAPALAQDYGRPGYGDHRNDWNRGPARPAVNNLLRQLGQVDLRIQRSVQRRVISQREAFSLRREANDIRVRVNV